jgi:hypothetical protein
MSDDSVGENVPHEQARVTRPDGSHSHVHAAQSPALFEVTGKISVDTALGGFIIILIR